MSGKRTLMVEAIKNLTKDEMYMYGTSGRLIKLEHVDTETILHEDYLVGKNVYYVASPKQTQRLRKDRRYVDKIATPRYCGTTRNHGAIYQFINDSGLNIVPVTDKTGESGAIKHVFHKGDMLLKLSV